MTKTYLPKPIKVEAFQYGTDKSPAWFLKALRTRTVQLNPAPGTVVAKTESGKINYYDPKTFNALFESFEEAKDINKDGVIDAREKAIASEVKKKRMPKKKKESVQEPSE